MITYTAHRTCVRKIKPGDPNFDITDNFIIYPRALIQIDQNCPAYYATVINECIKQGWIIPVAYMTEREMMFVGLTGKKQGPQN